MGVLRKLWAELDRRAAAVQLAPPLDPMSYPIYGLIVTALTIELVVLLITDFTFSPNFLLQAFYILVLMPPCAFLARRYGHAKIACSIEAIALPPICGALTVIATALLASIAPPFTDHVLVAADRALGFDWPALFALYQKFPVLWTVSRIAYMSLIGQLPLVSLAAFALGSRQRGWVFMTAWGIASAITVAIFPFFTAVGPYVYFGISRSEVPIHSPIPWTTGDLIESIRNGGLRELSKAMVGMVWFPSFHAATGVMFIWATRPLRFIRWISIPLNCLMIFATAINGYHYFVDIIGGIVVGMISIFLAILLMNFVDRDAKTRRSWSLVRGLYYI